MVEIEKNYESSTDARRLMRQVRGDQEQVNWTDKAPQSKRNSSRSQSQRNGKDSSRKQSECNYCEAKPSQPREKSRAFLLKYKCKKCGKEGYVARRSILFVYFGHSLRVICICTEGEKVFAAIKLSAAMFFCLENFAIRYFLYNKYTFSG